jgi:Ankyrin repeat
MNSESQAAFSDLGWGNGKQTLVLIQRGLNPDLVNDLGEPLILAAARSGCWAVFEALIRAGANPNAATPQGHGAYHYAVAGSVRGNYKYWALRCSRASRKIVEWYSQRGLLRTPDQVMYCIAMNRIGALRRMLAEGTDVNSRFADPSRVLLPFGMIDTARIVGLDLASKMGLTEIEQRLQGLRASDDKDQQAATAAGPEADPTILMWTHALGRTEFSALLLSHGADLSLRDGLGYTCHDYATLNKKPLVQGDSRCLSA